jgi:hypothetical protein
VSAERPAERPQDAPTHADILAADLAPADEALDGPAGLDDDPDGDGVSAEDAAEAVRLLRELAWARSAGFGDHHPRQRIRHRPGRSR